MSFTHVDTIDSIYIYQPMAHIDFSILLTKYLTEYWEGAGQPIVILCIGTDRSTGDSLGPLVGYQLERSLKHFPGISLWGTLENPVHAKNLSEKLQEIYAAHPNPFIIAIDACLGRMDRIGYIKVGYGPLKPGAGVNKDLPSVGNIHVTGIVNMSGYMEYLVLQNTRLSLVMKMAETIADGIRYSLWKLGYRGTPSPLFQYNN